MNAPHNPIAFDIDFLIWNGIHYQAAKGSHMHMHGLEAPVIDIERATWYSQICSPLFYKVELKLKNGALVEECKAHFRRKWNQWKEIVNEIEQP